MLLVVSKGLNCVHEVEVAYSSSVAKIGIYAGQAWFSLTLKNETHGAEPTQQTHTYS